ncbi:hypothetical protein HG530_015228 [Fusarium avenaceum]|nr:hypothetical protein HG530_015228 [Fusarium avenaceum]
MDLSIPSGYDSYSNRLDPHDEVDDGHVGKGPRLSSDERTLLKQRSAPQNKSGGTFDTIRLALRVLILLLDLSILSLLVHGVNVWKTTHNSVDRNEDGWVRTRWASIKMLSTWLMLAIAAFASFVQIVALVTRLSFFRSLRNGSVHTGALVASSGIVIGGWIAATVYLIVDKEILRNNHWDLWSWSCQNNSRQSYIPWATLCTEMFYIFAAGLVVIVLEILSLAFFFISLRGPLISAVSSDSLQKLASFNSASLCLLDKSYPSSHHDDVVRGIFLDVEVHIGPHLSKSLDESHIIVIKHLLTGSLDPDRHSDVEWASHWGKVGVLSRYGPKSGQGFCAPVAEGAMEVICRVIAVTFHVARIQGGGYIYPWGPK